jgi:hypothetical protein
MTVAELIKNLQMMPQDSEVLLELNTTTTGIIEGKAMSVYMYSFKDDGSPYGEVVISETELSIPDRPSFMF